jgi:uncharacterized protein YqeY
MSFEQTINDGIKAAMLAKDKIRLDALRAVKSVILLEKTSEKPKEIDEAEGIKMLQKLVKQRKETAEIYSTNNRQELADKELAEVAILEEFLPKQLSEAEIEAAVRAIVTETGATGMKEMGKVMGIASKQLAGKADGKLIADLVNKILQ